jgi:glycosyltransferase involved in cell wall biosynthesis
LIYGSGGREVAGGAAGRRQRAMRVLAPHIDRFTAVCRYLGDELARDFAVDAERVSVLKTGVNVGAIDAAPSQQTARARFGIPEEAIVIGAISVFRPVKRIPDLIDAAGELARTDPRIHLLLVGNPVRMTVEDLRERARESGLGDRIHLPGRLEDAGSIINAFDIFVNCSIFEGSSNAIIEAMAAGRPVVGTRVGGTPELVEDGDNGFLVDAENVPQLTEALRKLACNPELRKKMGKRGRERARLEHTEEKMVAAYLDMYRSEARQPKHSTVFGALRSLRELM